MSTDFVTVLPSDLNNEAKDGLLLRLFITLFSKLALPNLSSQDDQFHAESIVSFIILGKA